MTINPKVSIVTVVYNAEQSIETTIQSVINQTYTNIEYIIVDGKSTDATMKIIERYSSRIEKVVSERDGGIADAFNKSIGLASGEWINFMNAGDTFVDSEVVEKCVHYLSTESGSVMCGNHYLVDGQNIELKMALPSQLNKFAAPINPICHQATFIKKTTHDSYMYDRRLKYSMDYDLWLRMLRDRIDIVSFPVTVANYTAGGLSSSPQHALRSLIEHWNVHSLNTADKDIARFLKRLISLWCKLNGKRILGTSLYSKIKTAFVNRVH